MGVPSAISLGSDSRPGQIMGLAIPMCGLLVMWMAKGTACGSLSGFLGVSKNMRMRPSMKLSVQPVRIVGMIAAIGLARAMDLDGGSSIGVGVMGCAGLWRVKGSQLTHSGILLERAVTISEKAHHVGGLGDPPKVSLRAM